MRRVFTVSTLLYEFALSPCEVARHARSSFLGVMGKLEGNVACRLSDGSTTSSLQSGSPPGPGAAGLLAYQQRRAGGPLGDQGSVRGGAVGAAPVGGWAPMGYQGPGPGGELSGQQAWWGLDRTVSARSVRGTGPGWQQQWRPVPHGTEEWVPPP